VCSKHVTNLVTPWSGGNPAGGGGGRGFILGLSRASGGCKSAVVRVNTTNNNTDWTKKKQSDMSLVHDTGLNNGHPSKRHATLPTERASVRSVRLLEASQAVRQDVKLDHLLQQKLRVVAVQVGFER
jgi:hypothetical protein